MAASTIVGGAVDRGGGGGELVGHGRQPTDGLAPAVHGRRRSGVPVVGGVGGRGRSVVAGGAVAGGEVAGGDGGRRRGGGRRRRDRCRRRRRRCPDPTPSRARPACCPRSRSVGLAAPVDRLLGDARTARRSSLNTARGEVVAAVEREVHAVAGAHGDDRAGRRRADRACTCRRCRRTACRRRRSAPGVMLARRPRATVVHLDDAPSSMLVVLQRRRADPVARCGRRR